MIIRELTLKDSSLFKEAVDLLNRTQGEGIFPPDYVGSKINSPSSYVVAAFEGEQLLGIGIAEITDSFDFYLPFDPNIVKELTGKLVGSFSTLAVLEGRQGQGIGQKISLERLRWLKERCCKTILGVSWVSGLGHTSDRVFEKLNFKAVKKVDHFFGKMSVERNFLCPGCKVIPCTCSGILFRWDQK